MLKNTQTVETFHRSGKLYQTSMVFRRLFFIVFTGLILKDSVVSGKGGGC